MSLAVLDLVLNNKENVIRIIHTKYDRSIHNLNGNIIDREVNIIKVQNSSLASSLFGVIIGLHLVISQNGTILIAKNENI